jgi:3'(2'), 5'-bisphosphate nucleotidase
MVQLARKAGEAILEIKEDGFQTSLKSDGSPVTQADLAAEAVLADGLPALFPNQLIISEEGAGFEMGAIDRNQDFILVDPLDGTKEFMAGRSDYTVNIALIRNQRPILGCVSMPETGQSWVGDGRTSEPKAWRIDADGRWHPIKTRESPKALTVLSSRTHGDAQTNDVLAKLPVEKQLTRGSSLKFCLIAEGLGDLYPRFGPTMEWDTAAGDAVLTAAGGQVLALDGTPFLYGKFSENCLNCGFLATSGQEVSAAFLAALKP